MTNINKVTFTGRIKCGDIIKKMKVGSENVISKCDKALDYSFYDVSKFSKTDELKPADYAKIFAIASSTDSSLFASTGSSLSRIECLTSTISSLFG